ncbi:MAG: DNA replication and repair protein RecF [Oscillospiraceae bacterium]|nr:DNA replication and repair protein RecF [Oscillospiraceae bacterium]
MYIKKIVVNGFKNLTEIDFSPGKSFNIIYGRNAQGKTNLLEAVWISTGCRSFRGTREKDYIGFNCDKFEIEIVFENAVRTQQIEYKMVRGSGKNKLITLNGVPQKNSGRLFEAFKCISFLPEDIDLIKGNPEKRRSYIDLCYSQLIPRSMNYIRKYETLLMQRNAVIKNINSGTDSTASLDLWDQQLAVAGAYISFMRNKYVINLDKYCQELYSKVADKTEELSIKYQSNIYNSKFEYPDKPDKMMTDIYYNRLKNSISDDLRLGYTHTGVNRDDISLRINGFSVRDYGSQGQQKSTALVMKLAQAQIYMAQKDESPVILLDDVMGELDENRQKFVCSIIDGMQVFITTCNYKSIIHECENIFEMNEGILKAGK